MEAAVFPSSPERQNSTNVKPPNQNSWDPRRSNQLGIGNTAANRTGYPSTFVMIMSSRQPSAGTASTAKQAVR
jgi:hypothetical protein